MRSAVAALLLLALCLAASMATAARVAPVSAFARLLRRDNRRSTGACGRVRREGWVLGASLLALTVAGTGHSASAGPMRTWGLEEVRVGPLNEAHTTYEAAEFVRERRTLEDGTLFDLIAFYDGAIESGSAVLLEPLGGLEAAEAQSARLEQIRGCFVKVPGRVNMREGFIGMHELGFALRTPSAEERDALNARGARAYKIDHFQGSVRFEGEEVEISDAFAITDFETTLEAIFNPTCRAVYEPLD